MQMATINWRAPCNGGGFMVQLVLCLRGFWSNRFPDIIAPSINSSILRLKAREASDRAFRFALKANE